jgi:ADP-ribose pyrophosphatase YjhB (NUDIX family)
MALAADEQQQLVTLLRQLAEQGGAMPSTPRAIWDALAGVVPRLAVELVLRERGTILLSWRDDESWHGWHLPGGFVGCGESLADACRRIGARELGIEVELAGVIADFVWPDHPCGSVLSLLCAVRWTAAPTAGEFFTELPTPMVRHHAEFVARVRNPPRERGSW